MSVPEFGIYYFSFFTHDSNTFLFAQIEALSLGLKCFWFSYFSWTNRDGLNIFILVQLRL